MVISKLVLQRWVYSLPDYVSVAIDSISLAFAEDIDEHLEIGSTEDPFDELTVGRMTAGISLE